MPDQRNRWTAWKSRLRNSKGSARRVGRHLRLENLERRVVLSSLPDAVLPVGQCIDASVPVETSPVALVTVPDTQSPAADSTPTQDNVYQSSDGVVHVLPPSDGTAVVVRQFVDYRLQSVVEVELAGNWYTFQADSVSEVQVQTPLGTPNVDVTEGVTKPVRLVETQVVDDLFGKETIDAIFAEAVNPIAPSSTGTEGSLLTASVGGPIDTGSVVNSAPEGEGPPGGTGDPLLPPTIVDFNYSRELDCWSFTGQVLDDKEVTGLVINFGGILAGKTAVVNEDGYFRLIIELPPNTGGFATAHTVDTDGLDSNTPQIQIF